MSIDVKPFDIADHLGDDEMKQEFLQEAFDGGDAKHIAHALGIIARAKGMSQVAKETGLAREALYRSLSEQGDPKLSTLLGVMNALGVKLQAQTTNV